MIELVINTPHLQTSRQRLSTVGLAVLGWLMWCYFFFPLVSLGCWLIDDDMCSQWVNMAGGYLNLQEILAIYFRAIVAMLGIWLAWLIYDYFRNDERGHWTAPGQVSERAVVEAFGLNLDDLRACRVSRFAVVHYDAMGHIIELEALPVDRVDAAGCAACVAKPGAISE